MSGLPSISDIVCVENSLKKYRSPRWEGIFSSRTTALRTGAAWIPAHDRRTRLASSPTAGVGCPTWPTPLETEGSTTVGLDPPKTPASSAPQTPPTDAATRDQNYVRSDSPGFSAG